MNNSEKDDTWNSGGSSFDWGTLDEPTYETEDSLADAQPLDADSRGMGRDELDLDEDDLFPEDEIMRLGDGEPEEDEELTGYYMDGPPEEEPEEEILSSSGYEMASSLLDLDDDESRGMWEDLDDYQEESKPEKSRNKLLTLGIAGVVVSCIALSLSGIAVSKIINYAQNAGGAAPAVSSPTTEMIAMPEMGTNTPIPTATLSSELPLPLPIEGQPSATATPTPADEMMEDTTPMPGSMSTVAAVYPTATSYSDAMTATMAILLTESAAFREGNPAVVHQGIPEHTETQSAYQTLVATIQTLVGPPADTPTPTSVMEGLNTATATSSMPTPIFYTPTPSSP